MAAKKTNDSGNMDLQKLISGSNSYKSLVYGIITVVVLFVVVVLGIRTLSQDKGDIAENSATEQAQQEPVVGETYEVAQGDTLWSISETVYGTGYNWTDIAAENNISNADNISAGDKISIPNVTPFVALGAENEAVKEDAEDLDEVGDIDPIEEVSEEEVVNEADNNVTGDTYTVVRGDSLWTIAVAAYGDGFRWVDIANVNNLENPDIIHSGNVFTLPK